MQETIRRPCARLHVVACGLCLAVSASGPNDSLPAASMGGLLAGTTQAVPAASASCYVDAVVVDRNGNVVRDMKASDFSVTTDEGTRRVVSVIPLLSGPAAAESARALQSGRGGGDPARTRNSRVVLFVVDQASLLRGDEGRARAVVETCVGLLGFGDQVGLMVLPGPSGSVPMGRDEIRASLAKMKAMRAMDGSGADDSQQPGADAEVAADRANADRADVEKPAPERARSGKLEDSLAAGKLGTEEVVSPTAARKHAVAALNDLTTLLGELRKVPGGKTLFFVSAGLSNDELADEFDRLGESASNADTRIYALQVPTPARKFADVGRPGLEALARLTGGAFVALGSKPGEALQRTIAELTFSYLLVLEPDRTPRSGQIPLSVKPRRGGVVVRAAAFVVAGRALPGAELAVAAAPGTEPVAPTLTPAMSGAAAVRWKRDPAVDALVARGSEYVQNYWHEMSAVVAEEVYEQQVSNEMTGGTLRSMKLVSDFLLVKVPGDIGWLPFRDVFEVDGKQVRERQNRLQQLFVDAPADKAIQNANAIWQESARYNIGSVYRTLNVPTLPLMFLQPGEVARFEFRKAGEEGIDGMRAWVIEFRETARPTIIKTTSDGSVPAAGRFWIEPTSGRIVKTMLEAGGAVITVTYRPSNGARDAWFPATMDERYGRSIVAKARYSKIRRFQVFTEEKIKDPN